jgi:hypothetical protein
MELIMLARSLSATTLGVILLLLAAAPSGAFTLIFSENFNSVTPSNPGTLNLTSGVPGFTVTSGNVDLIGTDSFNFYPGNGTYVDLSGGTAGTIQSSAFNFTAGQTVTLSFSYGANGANRSAEVSLGSLLAPTAVNATQSTTFQVFTTTFYVASSTTASLRFTSLSLGVAGVVIDNVSITAVPEPAMLPALLTLGSVGGGLLLRRKQSPKHT